MEYFCRDIKIMEAPYFIHTADVVTPEYTGFAVGNDFNKDIVPPGINETFPDGVVGVRVDDDFWVVAALPYDEYVDTPIEDIVAEFWPTHTNIKYNQDTSNIQ